MKKVRMLFIGFTLSIMTFSCEEEDLEAGVEIAAIDGEAFGSSLAGCLETGVGTLCPPCCAELSTIAAVIFSAEAATPQRVNQTSVGHSRQTESEVVMPDSFLIPNNPYECSGIAHNKMLLYMLKNNKEQVIQNIINDDDATINTMATIYESCSPMDGKTRATVIEAIKTNLTPELYEEKAVKYRSITSRELFESNRALGDFQYYNAVYNEVIELKYSQNRNREYVVSHLNNKINLLLSDPQPMTSDKANKLSVLTVMKHSYYFWNN